MVSGGDLMAIGQLIDFKGGYATDMPPETMPTNMLQTAENCYWESGLKKRGGYSVYEAAPAGTTTIRGRIRVYMNSAWVTILAVDDGSDVTFYQNSSGSFAQIGTDTLTSGYDVEMDAMLEAVVAVNGQDKPRIIYYSTVFTISTLEAYDVRTRVDDDWEAGTYDGASYVDATDAAQDTVADDFTLVTGSDDGGGFYVAGRVTFNRVEFTNLSANEWATATFEYWNGAWTALTPTTTASSFEFDYPQDWATYTDTGDTELVNRMCVRVTWATAPASDVTCDSMTLKHTQYLSQILEDARPHLVRVHNNRVWLAMGNNLNYSPYESLTGWQVWATEYCLEGGSEILGLVSHGEALIAMKGALLYGILGNSYEDLRIMRLDDTVGTISGRSAAVVSSVLFYLGADGNVWGWTGDRARKVTGHIESDIADLTHTDCAAVSYNGRYYCSFPSDSVVLWGDPDTMRPDDYGEGIMSWWKYTGIRADRLAWQDGDGDDLALVAVDNSTPQVIQLENGNAYDLSSTAITMKAKTKAHTLGEFQTRKVLTRVKPKVSQSGRWTFTMYSDDDTENVSVTLQSGSGSGFYSQDISVPYSLDGKNIAFYLENATTNAATVRGVALEFSTRSF